jgi:anhydro-N-acetylmuramic acid kinase
MSFLDELAAKPNRLVAGAMSGTSMDSIDVAVCLISGAGPRAIVKLRKFERFPYATEIAQALRQPTGLSTQEVAELHVAVGRAFGKAVASTASGFQLDLVGSHGQTIYHHSRRENALKATFQIGDGDEIAELLGVPVVSDFRARDIAAGGEGAPLTPYADFVLFGGRPGVAVLNLGGIANLTLLGATIDDVRGFDTGPANGPLDRIAREDCGAPYDDRGEIARTGGYDDALLKDLISQDSFVNLVPPKSTGFETYGDPFVSMLRKRSGASGADLLRLATEFVVESVARQVPRSISNVILAGGGVGNAFLVERLTEQLAWCQVETSEEHGIPHQAREAMAFAILANDAVYGLATSLPSVTGARQARALGKLSWPLPTFGQSA